MAQKIANRLDDALMSGAITHDQYLAAGGRSPEIMLQGLRRGSDALVDRHRIKEIRSARELASPDTWRRAELRKAMFDSMLNRSNYSSEDFKALQDLRTAPSWTDASLDELYSKLDRQGQLLKDIDNKVNAKVGPHSRRAISRALRPEAIEASGAHSLPGSHVYTPTAISSVNIDPFEADFQAELVRRHEIDESRYSHLGQKSKKTLDSFGHVHPRVILNEHSNIARAPKNVRDEFIDLRNAVYEAPSYNLESGGRFEYGKALKGSKRSIENSIADKVLGYPGASFDARIKALEKANAIPLDFNRLKTYTQHDFTDPLVDAIVKAPESSLLGRLSKFIVKHSEYAPRKKSTPLDLPRLNKIANRLDDALMSGAITHDQYLAAGGRSPNTMLRGLRRGSDALAKELYVTEYSDPSKYFTPKEQKRIYSRLFSGVKTDPKELEEYVQAGMGRNSFFNRVKNFFSTGPSVMNDAHALPHLRATFVDKNPSRTGLERLKDLLSGEGVPRSYYDPYIYELSRRHELDEVRFRDDKLKLDSHGHSSPRVILQEHSNLMRMPPPVRDKLRRVRALTLEVPVFSALTDGDFVYGKSMSGPTNRLAKLIADSGADIKNSGKIKIKKLTESPDLLKHLKNAL